MCSEPTELIALSGCKYRPVIEFRNNFIKIYRDYIALPINPEARSVSYFRLFVKSPDHLQVLYVTAAIVLSRYNVLIVRGIGVR